MMLSTMTDANWCGLQLPPISQPEAEETERTLLECYRHLSANLSLPFTAYYPEPRSAEEKSEFRCSVVELLDPTKYLGDEYDGLFCRVRKGKFTVNLPLVELHVPEESPNFRLIEGYWQWFWNWQTVSYCQR